MAFLQQNTAKTVVYFGPLTQQNGPFKNRDWFYFTTDTPAVCAQSGYFNDRVNDLRIGDIIRVYQVTSLTDLSAGIVDIEELAVLVNTGTTVDVSEPLWGGSTVTYTA